MAKTCSVILNNDAVTVFNYDGVEVQIPSIRKDASTITVMRRGNQYIVVDDDYKDNNEVPSQEQPVKKAGKKKTTKQSSMKQETELDA